MKAYSIFQIVYAVILLFSFFYFIIIKQLSFRAMVYPMLLAYGVTTITIIIFIQRIVGIFKRIFDITLAKMLGKYAVATFIGGSSYIIYTNIDRIMLARYRSLSEVGFYSAYYAGSINIAMLIWGMFILVFFPTVSRYKNKGPVFKKINRVIPYLVVLGIPSLLVCEFIVLKFYGKQYQLNIISMLLFAVTSIFMVIQGTYASLLNSIGTRGAIISSLTAIIAALVNIGLNLVLIPAFGINGAIISLMTSYSAALIVILLFGRKHLRDDKLITIGE
jgi:O-antigen/teichoic acid export membrane protein